MDEQHHAHVHESAVCSGVFYVQAVSPMRQSCFAHCRALSHCIVTSQVPTGSSPIIFNDPRGTTRHFSDDRGSDNSNNADDDAAYDAGVRPRGMLSEQAFAPFVTQVAFKPRAGDLILFPSWLSHMVLPRQADAATEGPTPSPGSTLEAQSLRISFGFNLNADHVSSWGSVTDGASARNRSLSHHHV